MASAEDVTVIIPVSVEHQSIAGRADISAFESNVGNVRVFVDTWRSGVCHARNDMIREADTSLILPLDADDYLLPGAVERMAQAWWPGTVVYGNWREHTPTNWKPVEHEFNDKQAPPPAMLPRKHICHATYLFAKDDWQRVGGYDPDFNIGAEDHAFMIALVNAGCELVRLDGEPLYVKTMSDNGRTHKAIRHKHMIQELLREKYPSFFRTP